VSVLTVTDSHTTRVAKGWKISGKFPWEVKLGNSGNIPNWKLSMGIYGNYWEFMGIIGNLWELTGNWG